MWAESSYYYIMVYYSCSLILVISLFGHTFSLILWSFTFIIWWYTSYYFYPLYFLSILLLYLMDSWFSSYGCNLLFISLFHIFYYPYYYQALYVVIAIDHYLLYYIIYMLSSLYIISSQWIIINYLSSLFLISISICGLIIFISLIS